MLCRGELKEFIDAHPQFQWHQVDATKWAFASAGVPCVAPCSASAASGPGVEVADNAGSDSAADDELLEWWSVDIEIESRLSQNE